MELYRYNLWEVTITRFCDESIKVSYHDFGALAYYDTYGSLFTFAF